MTDSILLREVFCLYAGSESDAGKVAALRGLSLTVAAGERLVVHGPNGSGKTTLLRVLMGELRPSAGSATVAGIDLSGAGAGTRRHLKGAVLGVVDQHASRVLRPELTVADNVALQLRLAGGRRSTAHDQAAAMLERLSLSSLADRSPAELSGGEAQRVAVCAALAHRPSIVLADEPTGELDAAAASNVYDLLAAAVAEIGATLVLVSHDQRAGRIADRVVRIRDGRLSEQWSPHTPRDEALVVDDRGWLRLPGPLRRQIGGGSGLQAVRAEVESGRIVLNPLPIRPTEPDLAAEPVEAASQPALNVSAPASLARLRGIGVSYGNRTVIDDFDLDLAPGQLSVIVGPSGSGKSTLLRILLGLTDPDAGSVVLNGRELARLSRTDRAVLRRHAVAVATQNGSLSESLDVSENIAFAQAARGLTEDRPQVRRLMAQLDLHALVGRPVRLLSGGERQRTALARCLAAARPLIVLDEPTSHQDEAHAELIAAVIAAAAERGTGILCATHDPRLVDGAQSVLTLGAPGMPLHPV